MKKLFIFYLGGRAKKSNIELHDVFFGVGENWADCYPLIKKHWFGELTGLHIDCYAEIEHIDGHDVVIRETDNKEKSSRDKKLFFVNLGAYQNHVFEEKHYFKTVIAENVSDAKRKAKSSVENENQISMLHADNTLEIDDVLIPDELIEPCYAIELLPSTAAKKIRYTHGYFLVP